MARCCGSTGTCACKIVEGNHVSVTGSGTSQDPFVVAGDLALNPVAGDTFTVGITGAGTLDSPWAIEVYYSPGAQLSDLPDVGDVPPTNGQVLGWSDAEGAWIPQPPTTATPGGVVTDTSLNGDGSTGAPLAVRPHAARYIQVSADGVGLTNDAINQMVRVFADATARAAASPAPRLGTISVLDSDPGRLDFYDGTTWLPIDNGISLAVQPGSLLELSGPYAGGRVWDWVDQISVVTDASGDFTILSATDIGGFAGVLTVNFQETGTTAWKAVVRADDPTSTIIGRAFNMLDGTALAGFTATGTVRALLY